MTSQFQILNGCQTTTNIALLHTLEEHKICNYDSNRFSIGIGSRPNILTQHIAPYPHLLCEWCPLKKNAMLVVLPHIPHLLCAWRRLKKCHVSEKCHVSGFGPYPHLLCAWCRLKKMPC